MERRKVNANAIIVAPEVQVHDYLSSIASVRSAVETACLDEGTTFKESMNSFDYKAFYMPLIMVAGQMKAVTWAVDRWAFRAKYMKHIDRELAHIYSSQNLTDNIRFAKISDRLSSCKPYDELYREAFRNVIKHLDLLLEALAALISFISLICQEGDILSFDHPEYLRARNREAASNDEKPSMAFRSNIQINSSSCPNIGCPVCPSHLATRPHPATPTWKLRLAYKYASDKLYVGPAELEVFAKTLSYAQIARRETRNTSKMVHDIADLADDMQVVFDEWNKMCEVWEMDNRAELEGGIGEDAIFDETEL